MKNQIHHLPAALRAMVADHFVLLESQNVAKKRDSLQLNLSGYSDVFYLIADLTKVCMLALENETSLSRIPEPSTNICGVLGIILDLLPYEEADFLDKIREAALQPEVERLEEEGFLLENLYLTLPTGILLSEEGRE